MADYVKVDLVADADVEVATGLAAGQVIDGQTLVAGWTVLLTASGALNGVYHVPRAGAAPRHADFKEWNDLAGVTFFVMRGAAYAETRWIVSSDPGAGVLDTDILTIVQDESGGGGDEVDEIAADLEAHLTDTSNPHGVTKAQVGLGSVDDTADTDKPISGPQQTALDLKFDKADIDTDPNLTANSDLLVASQKAVKTLFGAVSGGSVMHSAVAVVMTTNVDIATELEDGDTLNGLTLVTGERVLLVGQTDPSENGVYAVAAAGAAARHTAEDSSAELVGSLIPVIGGGTLNDLTMWACTTPGPIVVDTDPINFTQIPVAGAYTAGAGLTLTGSEFATDFETAYSSTSAAKAITPSYLQGITSRNVLRYGANNAGGAGVNVAAFQAAVNAVTNGKNAFIVVPPGTYADDLSTVVLGNRNICWLELENVTYSTARPPGVHFGNNPLSAIGGFGFGFDRTSEQGPGLPNKPTLVIRRVTGHTSGIAGTAEPGPLLVRHEINTRIDNAETSVYITLDVNVNGTPTPAGAGAPAASALRAQARKFEVQQPGFAGTSIFGFNPSAQDATTRKSSISGGAIIVDEHDMVASGPDDSLVRSCLDVTFREFAASADGASSFAYGVRVIPARSLAFGPCEVLHGVWIGEDGNGSIRDAIHIENCTRYGLNVEGDAPSTAAIRVFHDDNSPALIRIGAQTTSGETARLAAYANNGAGSEVQYGYMRFMVDSAVAAARTGRIELTAFNLGVETPMLMCHPNNDASNPIRLRVGGTLRKVTVDASGFLKAV